MIVAIDGPAGAGKSTVARMVAARLGFGHLDSGAMYRALAWRALRDGVDADDGPALAALAARTGIALAAGPDGRARVSVDGVDVTAAVRAPELAAAASAVARHGEVRRQLVARQRALLATGDWVADGRDIGSVVAPGAEVKVYLDADPVERARRRAAELETAGAPARPLAEILAEVEARDRRDTTRAESPLVVAPGAVVVDTTRLDEARVVDRIAGLVAVARR